MCDSYFGSGAECTLKSSTILLEYLWRRFVGLFAVMPLGVEAAVIAVHIVYPITYFHFYFTLDRNEIHIFGGRGMLLTQKP